MVRDCADCRSKFMLSELAWSGGATSSMEYKNVVIIMAAY